MSKNKMTKHLFLMNMIIVLTLLCGIAGSVFVYQKHREYLFYNDARILLADELKLIGDCYTGDVFDAEAFERGRSAEPDYKLVVVNTEGTVLYSEDSALHGGVFSNRTGGSAECSSAVYSGRVSQETCDAAGASDDRGCQGNHCRQLRDWYYTGKARGY